MPSGRAGFCHKLTVLLAVLATCCSLEISDEDRRLICDKETFPYPSSEDRSSIRWLHIPKTGTSFANTIWHYGCNLTDDVSVAAFDHRFELSVNDMFPIGEWCHRLVDHSPGTHKPIGNNEWERNQGNFVTLMREPKSRILSAFSFGNHHCIKDCNPENDDFYSCESVRNTARRTSPECNWLHGARCPTEYASKLPAQGCATKMILGYSCNAKVNLTAEDTNRALQRLRNGFGFVGLVEEWSLSICLFHRIMGGDLTEVENAHVRSSDHDYGPSDCSGEAQDDLDAPVYEEAKKIFDEKVQEVLLELRKGNETAGLENSDAQNQAASEINRCPIHYPICGTDSDCIKFGASSPWNNAPTADTPPGDRYNYINGYDNSGNDCQGDFQASSRPKWWQPKSWASSAKKAIHEVEELGKIRKKASFLHIATDPSERSSSFWGPQL